MKKIALLLSAPFLFACSSTKKQPNIDQVGPAIPSLELIWETDTLMTTSESVLYDKVRGVIYVSNINSNPWEKDGNGFISKLDTIGNIIELQWVNGLDAPKGMGIYNNSLFVNDIDQIIEIDIETRQIKGRTKIGGKPDLNDITIDDAGAIYSSASSGSKIFRLQNGILDVLFDGDLGRPNGLLYHKGHLLLASSNANKLYSINLETKEKTEMVNSLGKADGIVSLNNGAYVVSNWEGEIYYISKGLQRTKILDTRDKNKNTADIDYIANSKLLLVPTFFGNSVAAYKLIE